MTHGVRRGLPGGPRGLSQLPSSSSQSRRCTCRGISSGSVGTDDRRGEFEARIRRALQALFDQFVRRRRGGLRRPLHRCEGGRRSRRSTPRCGCGSSRPCRRSAAADRWGRGYGALPRAWRRAPTPRAADSHRIARAWKLLSQSVSSESSESGWRSCRFRRVSRGSRRARGMTRSVASCRDPEAAAGLVGKPPSTRPGNGVPPPPPPDGVPPRRRSPRKSRA